MSRLYTNFRLLARFPALVHVSRMNATTTTSSKINPPVIPGNANRGYMQAGALAVGIAGLYALYRMSTKEEKLIEHSVDKKPQSSAAPSK